MRYLALLLFSVLAYGQQQNYNGIPDCSLGYCAGNGVPTFACIAGQKFTRVDTPGNNYSCTGFPPHWVADAGNGGGAVSSVFTRTGDIAANTGDYTAAKVTNAADLSASSNIFTGSITGNTGVNVGTGANQYRLLAPGAGAFEILNAASTAAIGMIIAGTSLEYTVTSISPTVTSAQNDVQVQTGGGVVAVGSQKIQTDSANFYDPSNSYELQLNTAGPSGTVTGHIGEGNVTTTIQNTNIKLQGITTLAADPTVALGAATKQYVDANAGSGGVTYPSATANVIPAAVITGGVTSLVNTAFSDNTTNTFDSEPLYLVGEYQQATGTATSGSNFVSNVTNWLISYWNGTTAVSASWNVYAWVAQGASPPASVLTYYAPANLPVTAVLYAIDPGLAATSGINYASPKFKVRGSCWNSTASVLDDWNWQSVPGTGANPTETLQFTHSGCGSSQVQVEMPGLKLDGAPSIGSGTASNSDISGELAFSAATTASYTFANTYSNHPECVFAPQFSTTVAHWVTYTGVASFTINFASAVTGSASYLCISRN